MQIFEREHHERKIFLPGTRRSRSPEDTLQDFGRHMPRVGITRLANVTGLDSIGIPVVQAIRPNARSLSVSQGKGADLASAKVSAMMEAIELWHAERIESPCLYASYTAIRRERTTIDLDALPVLKGRVIRHDEQRCWLCGWDLLQQEEVWVPFEVVTMNTVGIVQATLTFLATSNGLASGNHILEAIEHALGEIVERDAHALHVARGLDGALGCKVDLDTVTDTSVRSMLDACAAANLDVAVFEMESDVGVPSFRAGLMEREGERQWRRLGTEWGAGTHLSPVVALSRAITEAAQARLTMIAGSRDDNPPAAYAATQGVWTVEDVQRVLFTEPPARPFAEVRPVVAETDTFEGDVGVMIDALRRVDAERVVVVDLTREDLGIPVAKVIVPDLEAAPFVPGYVEGPRARRAREEASHR
jgi:ribosomal protein S12 methylthiotransferase accessory factor